MRLHNEYLSPLHEKIHWTAQRTAGKEMGKNST
jgi:hypothetical protein